MKHEQNFYIKFRLILAFEVLDVEFVSLLCYRTLLFKHCLEVTQESFNLLLHTTITVSYLTLRQNCIHK